MNQKKKWLLGVMAGAASLAAGWNFMYEGASTGIASNPVITAMSSTRMAIVGGSSLGAFDLPVGSLVGSSFTPSGSPSNPCVSAMSPTRVAYVCRGTDQLRAYDFNGSTWSLVGSAFTLTDTSGTNAVVALNSTDVAYMGSNEGLLKVYRFNGSTWSQVGSSLSVTASRPVMGAMSSSRVVMDRDGSGGNVSVYDWNGSTWSKTGSDYSIGTAGMSTGFWVGVVGLSSTRAAICTAGNGTTPPPQLGMFEFNGSTWSLVGSVIDLPTNSNLGRAHLAKIDADTVAHHNTNGKIRVYKYV